MATNLEDMIDKVNQFCKDRDWDQYHNPKDLSIGLSTEANELLDLFRFKSDEQMNEMIQNESKREQISEELADILFFLLRFSQMYKFDLDKGLEDKLRKNNMKYPVEKVKGKNLNYTEY